MTTEETLKARKSQFIQIFAGVHSINSESPEGFLQCENMFESELFNFLQMFKAAPKLEATTTESRANVFLEVVSNGLTFSPSIGHVYLTQRIFTTETPGTDDQGRPVVYKNQEARLQWQKTVDGKLFLCVKAGSVVSIKPPVIVYEGDAYSYTDRSGDDELVYTERKEKKDDDRIIGGYVWVREPNNIKTLYRMDISDLDRLKEYSARQNGTQGANALYKSGKNGQVDTGFFKTKIKSHALNNYMDKATALSGYSAILEDNDWSRGYREPEEEKEPEASAEVPPKPITKPEVLPVPQGTPAPKNNNPNAFQM